MAQIPFWLHRPLKRFIQYWGVVFASLPAGILCLILIKALGPNLAFILTLPIALATAYFVWHWLDRHVSFARKPKPLVYSIAVDSANTFVSVPGSAFGFAGALIVVFVVTSPPKIPYPSFVSQDYKGVSVAADNVLIHI
jgi:hypothetical protein